MKKKDKKEFKRKDVRLKNLDVSDLGTFEDEDDKILDKTTTKIEEKYKKSKKSGLKLQTCRVIKISSNYKAHVLCGEKIYTALLSGRLKQIAFDTKNIIAIGDLVKVDLSANPRIEEICERKNVLSRFNEGKIQKKIIIAANIDYLIITVSYDEPPISYGLIDRYICASEIENITPIICVNKIDLKKKNDKQFDLNMEYYKSNGYKVIYVSALTQEGLDDLKEILKDKISVFSGHSGVGKSSIINKLQPGLNLSVNQISNHTKKGVHTTTTATMFHWDFGGFLIDTPGIKTFTLRYEDIDKIPKVFPGFSELSLGCKFSDCTHTHEDECKVKEAVRTKIIPQEKYESYLRIYNSLRGN